MLFEVALRLSIEEVTEQESLLLGSFLFISMLYYPAPRGAQQGPSFLLPFILRSGRHLIQ